ncbi:MAG: bifunctional folylpolyglutamate synthase/dihydrofolate synthase, partial [Lentisphaeria bacterium]|nr:bifunctional folylpolyglutamate synthase/dihydrofolate synthase [Lentisphaeria bacterium]
MFDAEKYISELDIFGIRLGLERVSELKKLAGDPDRDLKFIHLAGTNGKGSTGAMLECALRNSGYTTGFYSSPHLIDIRERFRINGRSVERQIFEQETEKLSLLAGDDKFSYFEFTTVLAMQIFKSTGCDFVIWETGMGGRLDATNVVTPEAVVITNIALDHQDHLGSTVAAIAAEKAGIIKKRVPLFYGKLDDEAREVICAKAQELGCSICPPAAEVPEAESIRELDDRFVQEFTYCNDHV